MQGAPEASSRIASAVLLASFTVLSFGAFVAIAGSSACSGDGETDGGVLFEKPQILPDNNPVCLWEKHVEVGASLAQPMLLQNAGQQELTIASATIAFDRHSAFTLNGPDRNTVPSLDFAVMQLRYAPTEPGWDPVIVQVRSNAENYPQLDVYVLARAEPAGLDGGTFDAGPRPPESTDQCPNAP